MKVRLKEIRLSRGLSQNKLAQLVDMTLQNIQKIEYGKTKGLQYDALNKLCKVLSCQPGDLLVYEPDDDSPEQIQIINQQALSGLKQGKDSGDESSAQNNKPTRSFLTVVCEVADIPEIPESA